MSPVDFWRFTWKVSDRRDNERDGRRAHNGSGRPTHDFPGLGNEKAWDLGPKLGPPY